MKRQIAVAIFGFALLLAATSASGQTVLLFESFDWMWETTMPPLGWTIAFTGDTSSNDWHRARERSQPWTANTTAYPLIDSAGPEEGTDSLISPPFSCAGYNGITLRCSTYFAGAGSTAYSAQLLGSVGGGPFDRLIFDYTGQNIGPALQVFELPWAAGQPNVRLAWVFSGLSSDFSFWAIDNFSVLGTPVNNDVACTGILVPPAVIDSGTEVAPRIAVTNRGINTASFLAYFSITRFGELEYFDSLIVGDLAPGATRNLDFTRWTAGARGIRTATAYLVMAGDENPANDTIRMNFRVRVLDASCRRIIAPADTVDSGLVITPQALIANYSSDSATFFVFCQIDTRRDSVLVTALPPNESTVVDFAPWVADRVGQHSIRCTTALTNDLFPANNALSRVFYVERDEFRDAAAISIRAPAGTVPESAWVTPAGVVTYTGPRPATTKVRLALLRNSTIVYHESTSVVLQPGVIDTVTFPQWFATPIGSYTAELLVQAAGDDDPANNFAADSFAVGAAQSDVGATTILAPTGRFYVTTVTPKAVVRNFGSRVATFWSRFSITSGSVLLYRDSARAVSLAPGESLVLTFRSWNAIAGTFTARCSTRLPGDAVNANDRVTTTFTVDTFSFPLGWHEVSQVPFAPSSKDVSGGGSLVYLAANGYVYALKGNKTCDFFAYDPLRDSWLTLPSVPTAPSGKPVGNGGTLITDGNRYIYATKGNNTTNFYRFDIVTNTWTTLDSVPLGLSRKKVKGGTSAAFVAGADGDYVYLLKGYKNEFYRYRIADDSWQTLDPAPATASDKYDKGSFIVTDGSATIYCHQAKLHKFYAFDIATQRWRTTPLDSMPIVNGRGKAKKSKDGAAAVWSTGFICALKGGNTNEFWRYSATLDTWRELDTIPGVGSSQRKKYVKSGGAIASFSSDIFFILKGGKTHECWRYRFGGPTAVTEPALSPVNRSYDRLRLWPNPARGLVTISLSPAIVTRPRPLLRVYDSHGAVRLEQPATTGLVRLDCRSLTAGVYFVRLVGTDQSAQLILE